MKRQKCQSRFSKAQCDIYKMWKDVEFFCSVREEKQYILTLEKLKPAKVWPLKQSNIYRNSRR